MEKETKETEKENRIKGRFEKENNKIFLWCYKDVHWQYIDVCKAKCSERRQNKCYSYRLLIGNPMRNRKTKREVRKNKEG
jgi:hypothetical protein